MGHERQPAEETGMGENRIRDESDGVRPGIDLDAFLRRQRVPASLATLILAIARATERIEATVRRAPLLQLTGLTGATNVQGEAVRQLDELANQVFIETTQASRCVSALVSEELTEPLALGGSPYALYIDPVDGSANVDVNGVIASIFSIHPAHRDGLPGPGSAQLAAGYVMYGPATSMMLTWRDGLHELFLDPETRAFRLTRANLRVPRQGRTYGVNGGRRPYWSPAVRAFLDDLTRDDPSAGRPYSLRYSGSLVADLHRILIEGGIFCYPGDTKARDGKLRLLYEAAPLALLAHAGGGLATSGTTPILDVVPRTVHQRVPLYIGSADDVALAEDYLLERRPRR
jgi:fructose-1,6-bisphosphatase I